MSENTAKEAIEELLGHSPQNVLAVVEIIMNG